MAQYNRFLMSARRLRHNLSAWNTYGEGIHSPYLFDLVRHALREEGVFYCWSQLRPNKVERTVFRLLNFLRQQSGAPLDIIIVQEKHQGKPKYRLAQMAKAVDSRNNVQIAEGPGGLESLYVSLGEKSVLVITDIHATPEAETYWTGVQQRQDVTTTMDFFDVGFVFYDPHYLRKNYCLKLL